MSDAVKHKMLSLDNLRDSLPDFGKEEVRFSALKGIAILKLWELESGIGHRSRPTAEGTKCTTQDKVIKLVELVLVKFIPCLLE